MWSTGLKRSVKVDISALGHAEQVARMSAEYVAVCGRPRAAARNESSLS